MLYVGSLGVCAIPCASWEAWILYDPRVSESVFLIWVVLPQMGSVQPEHLHTVALVVQETSCVLGSLFTRMLGESNKIRDGTAL